MRSHLHKSQSCFCHVPAFCQDKGAGGSTETLYQSIGKHNFHCFVLHFTDLYSLYWHTVFEKKKKDCSADNSVRMETAGVWVWEGLFICTKWHIELFDTEEVNSNHCPWRHKPYFLLKVLKSQALRHCMQPHRDCSVQQALNRQNGSLQTPDPLQTAPSDPIFCSTPQGKSCQLPSRAKQSLETLLQVASVWARSPDPRDNRAPVPASASGTHHFKVCAHEPTEVILVPPVQLGTHKTTTTTKKWHFDYICCYVLPNFNYI